VDTLAEDAPGADARQRPRRRSVRAASFRLGSQLRFPVVQIEPLLQQDAFRLVHLQFAAHVLFSLEKQRFDKTLVRAALGAPFLLLVLLGRSIRATLGKLFGGGGHCVGRHRAPFALALILSDDFTVFFHPNCKLKKVSAALYLGVFAKMPPHVCIFCGDTRMVVYKQLSTSTVLGIVDRQFKAGMRDPAILLLRNTTQPLRATIQCSDDVPEGATAPREADAACEDVEHSGSEESPSEGEDCESATGADEASLQCCICCFHWISRRRNLPITVLPMQCLLYFVLGLSSVERKQCDTRVLTRLAMTIGEEGSNFWRSVFRTQELEAIEFIAQKKRRCVEAQVPFCVKRELAAFYHAQNGGGMLLASRNVADLLRTHCADNGEERGSV